MEELKTIHDWHSYFIADFDSGKLTWKPRARHHFHAERSWNAWNARFAGKAAGYAKLLGYRRVRLFGKMHLSHRVLWEMAHGAIPAGIQIDHIDRNKDNNSISNLRLATQSENSRNVALQSSNTSGVKGVSWDKWRGLWRARINHNSREIYLGYFPSKEEAAAAYAQASIEYHGAFAPSLA